MTFMTSFVSGINALKASFLANKKRSTTVSVPARVRHCVNPAKDREMAPAESGQGPLWIFPSLIPWA